MAKPQIADIEKALLAAIRSEPALAFLKTVEALSSSSLDFATQQFVTVPPAVLVLSIGGPHEDRVVDGTLYRHRGRWLLFAAARNLRSAEAARLGGIGADEKGVYEILDALRDLFAGKQLEISGLAGPAPVCYLRNLTFEQAQPDGLVIFSLELEVVSHWSKT